MFAAALAALALWAWWILQDLPMIVGRPHQLAWDIISFSRQLSGEATAGPNVSNLGNPLVRLGVWFFRHCGGHYWSMVLPQAPFLLMLVVSSGLLAWRLGGRSAGAIAPWITVFAPMTVGLAINLDDLTPLQAMMTTALAALAWSDVRKRQFVGLLAVPCAAFGGKAALWFSTGLFFLSIFAVAAGSLVLWQWGRWLSRRRLVADAMGRPPGWFSSPWPATLCALLAVAACLSFYWPLPSWYLTREVSRPDLARLSWRNDLSVLLLGLVTWFRFHAGPTLGAITLAGLAIALRRRVSSIFPLMGWTFLPAILIAFLTKRHDFYLVTAVPGTYVLAAVGLGSLKNIRYRRAAVALAVALLANAWLGVMAKGAPNPTGRFSQMFEGHISPYLFSPYDFPRDGFDVVAGQYLAEKCGPRDLTVVIARVGQVRAPSAFYAWYADPKLRILDFNPPPRPPYKGFCLVLDNFDPATDSLPVRLHEIIAHNELDTPLVIQFVNELFARSSRFTAKQVFNQTIFVEPSP
jgi:hypothetical protein